MKHRRQRYVEAFRSKPAYSQDEWNTSFVALTNFYRQNDRLPKLTALTTDEERILARWLNHQRRQYRSRQLARTRTRYLDDAVPTWRPAPGAGASGRRDQRRPCRTPGIRCGAAVRTG